MKMMKLAGVALLGLLFASASQAEEGMWTRKYPDVRLVMIPEYAVGAFGGDPDNFNFPRYNFDVSFLRL
jgi:hypothetical protein